MTTNYRLARQIRDYVRDRAKIEGALFDLPLGLFNEAVHLGAAAIFGVYYDEVRILGDYQEPHPGYCKAWLERHARR